MDPQTRIKEIVDGNRIVLFMKGTPDFPRCGFSMRAASILRALGQPFQHVDVLEDDAIRQGIKVFSNWPTIPQVYVDQQFLGGSDVLMEMWEAGELEKIVS